MPANWTPGGAGKILRLLLLERLAPIGDSVMSPGTHADPRALALPLPGACLTGAARLLCLRPPLPASPRRHLPPTCVAFRSHR
eukprot:scaffold8920_cov131-Isochrysis_galbana.AAC.4